MTLSHPRVAVHRKTREKGALGLLDRIYGALCFVSGGDFVSEWQELTEWAVTLSLRPTGCEGCGSGLWASAVGVVGENGSAYIPGHSSDHWNRRSDQMRCHWWLRPLKSSSSLCSLWVTIWRSETPEFFILNALPVTLCGLREFDDPKV
jgi:hypothetical protein